MTTAEILGKYLNENRKTHLGANDNKDDLSPSDKKLLDSLEQKNKTNKILIFIMFIVLILILSLSFYFVLLYRDKPKVIIMLLSGTSLSTFGVVARMHRIWIDKYKLDLISSGFPFLTQSERIKIVMSFCRIDEKNLFSFRQQPTKKSKTKV